MGVNTMLEGVYSGRRKRKPSLPWAKDGPPRAGSERIYQLNDFVRGKGGKKLKFSKKGGAH